MNILDDLEYLYLERGRQKYERGTAGGVSQLEHALQCADHAVRSRAPDTLVAAALLHDLGHLLYDGDTDELGAARDDVHQYMALPYLRPSFPAAVLEPIKLHVDAKRYLCAVEPEYRAGLSAGSEQSLLLQGGAFDRAQCETFINRPYAMEAVALRRWDDRSKDPERRSPPFEHYRDLLIRIGIRRLVTV